jgi:hypothetical protein
LRRLLTRNALSILATKARTGARCRPQGDLRRRSGVLLPSRRQGAPLHPSGHCDDQCPPCLSASRARCAEASRSSGAGRRRLPARSRARTGAPSLEFSEGVEPRFSGVTETRSLRPLCAARTYEGPERAIKRCWSRRSPSRSRPASTPSIGEQFLSTPVTRKERFSSPPNERLAGAACFSSDVTATAKGALDIQAAPT